MGAAVTMIVPMIEEGVRARESRVPLREPRITERYGLGWFPVVSGGASVGPLRYQLDS